MKKFLHFAEFLKAHGLVELDGHTNITLVGAEGFTILTPTTGYEGEPQIEYGDVEDFETYQHASQELVDSELFDSLEELENYNNAKASAREKGIKQRELQQLSILKAKYEG